MRQKDSNASEPGEGKRPPGNAPAPQPPREGNSGQGSDSVVRQLRLWEQRRAKDRARSPDKPGGKDK